MLQQYQMIGEILFRFCAKLHWKNKQVLLLSTNAWIGTHAMFPVIPKRCCHFSVVLSFQFEFTTHLTYLQGTFMIIRSKIQLSWVLMLYYPYKTMFSMYKSVIVTPWACNLFVSKVKKITWSVFGCHFSALFQCDDCILKPTIVWLLKLSVLYIYSFMQVYNTTFQIKTVFHNVLFSTEVHNPLHAHLLALSHIYIYMSVYNRKSWLSLSFRWSMFSVLFFSVMKPGLSW